MILLKLILIGLIFFSADKAKPVLDKKARELEVGGISNKRIAFSTFLVLYSSTLLVLPISIMFSIVTGSENIFYIEVLSIYSTLFVALLAAEIWKYGSRDNLTIKKLVFLLLIIVSLLSPIFYFIDQTTFQFFNAGILTISFLNIALSLLILGTLQIFEGYPA